MKNGSEKYDVKACPNCTYFTNKNRHISCYKEHTEKMEEWFENYGKVPLRDRNESMDIDCDDYEDNMKITRKNELNAGLAVFMSELDNLLKN